MVNSRILMVDDDEKFLNIYSKILKRKNYIVTVVNRPEKALKIVEENDTDIVIADMYMPGVTGIDLINKIKQISPKIEIILVTGNGSIDNAVEAMKAGAYSYIQKPINIDELILSLNKIEEILKMRNENEYLRDQLFSFKEPFIGSSDSVVNLKKMIKKVAKSNSSVLITGESGTGKELVAKAVHNESERREGHLVKVNCSALSEGLLESELFGHEKGAFTGAMASRSGRFEIANNGTLFLDEVGEISHNIQVKLLRVLQEKEFERVGGTKTIKTNFRLITATNRDLVEEIRTGGFREDLYYRLNVIPIRTPALRERKSDIPELIEYFSDYYAKEMNKTKVRFTDDAKRILVEHNWPGNIRELKNVVERMTVLSNHIEVGSSDMLTYLFVGNGKSFELKANEDLKSYREAKQQFEISYIQKALERNSYNITKTAEFMEIARKNLQLKLKTYNINTKIKGGVGNK